MDKIYKKYQGHTIENGFSETSPDFKKFASYVKKRMKIAAADRGIVLEDFFGIVYQMKSARNTVLKRYQAVHQAMKYHGMKKSP